jgi:hypothetical protein
MGWAGSDQKAQFAEFLYIFRSPYFVDAIANRASSYTYRRSNMGGYIHTEVKILFEHAIVYISKIVQSTNITA